MLCEAGICLQTVSERPLIEAALLEGNLSIDVLRCVARHLSLEDGRSHTLSTVTCHEEDPRQRP